MIEEIKEKCESAEFLFADKTTYYFTKDQITFIQGLVSEYQKKVSDLIVTEVGDAVIAGEPTSRLTRLANLL